MSASIILPEQVNAVLKKRFPKPMDRVRADRNPREVAKVCRSIKGSTFCVEKMVKTKWAFPDEVYASQLASDIRGGMGL